MNKSEPPTPEQRTALLDKKAAQAADGRLAMTEYLEEQDSTRARTEKLRALRLARDADVHAANLRAASVAAPKSPKSKTKSQTKSLAKKPPAKKQRSAS